MTMSTPIFRKFYLSCCVVVTFWYTLCEEVSTVGEHARIVGERIKLLRDEKGWGQAELAERLHAAGIGTNRETISRWE